MRFHSGSCVAGVCQYHATETDCAFGCYGNSCRAHPCADVVCDASEVCQAGTCKWNDATLTSLVVDPGSIAFSPDLTTYSVLVPMSTTSVSVTAVLANPGRSVLRINGVVVASGTTTNVAFPSQATIPLVVQVDAESGAAMVYSVSVTRSPLATVRFAQQAYLKASNTDIGDEFGSALALSADGKTLAVGAFYEASASSGINGNQSDNTAPNAGAAYVFTRTNGTWAQEAYLKASNAAANEFFGHSVALSGDGNFLVVGASQENSSATGINGNQLDNSAPASGAVYIFNRAGGIWSQQAYVKASNTGLGDGFGEFVALSFDGSTLAVGARWEASGASGVNGNQTDNSVRRSGAVYVFTYFQGVWSQQAYIKASNPGVDHLFGGAVTLSSNGDVLAVGASFENSGATGVDGNQADNSSDSAGAAYVFARASGSWVQQAYLKASNTNAKDKFGMSLALSGDGTTLAVGAGCESSATTGVNGNQADNSATCSGATYIFAVSNGVWAQQAYLKASNTAAGDLFGWSLALSGDGNDLAVAALWEDSGATGVSGSQTDNSRADSGAVYLFARANGNWAPQAYYKASNTGYDDNFGWCLAISGDGDTLATTAHWEDSAATGVNGNQTNDAARDSGAAYIFSR
ncbi:MAG: cadherin-like beta sandwich domain-containing protein [Myxococcota bacterium]